MKDGRPVLGAESDARQVFHRMAAFALLAGLIAMAHPDLIRVLVLAAYEESGRPLDPRAYELATSNTAIAARTGVTLAKVTLCEWLLFWNRDYFEKRGQTPFS